MPVAPAARVELEQPLFAVGRNGGAEAEHRRTHHSQHGKGGEQEPSRVRVLARGIAEHQHTAVHEREDGRSIAMASHPYEILAAVLGHSSHGGRRLDHSRL